MKRLLLLTGICLFFSCKNVKNEAKYSVSDAQYIHQCEKKLTDIIVLDIFSPPVASRIYAYPTLAAYETMKFSNPAYHSITQRLHGFAEIPAPEAGKEYDYTVAGVKAFCTTARKVIFSVKELEAFETEKLAELKKRCDDEVYNRSIAFGEKVAGVIITRLSSDMYKQTRGMERFEVKPIKGRWVPTLPDYADGVEPHWKEMKPLVMDSSAACKPPRPPAYNEDKNSPFWKEVEAVFESVNQMTPERDEIVRFWDDNPFVSRSKGHLMFQEKKMTPGGHWMAICRTICQTRKCDLMETTRAYALTSVSLFDGFISAWDEKYRSVKVRPETVIKEKINKDWQPYLVTPPFPAYTSAHSTVSGAASEALTFLFGDNLAYTDSTEREYDLPVRSFTSFRKAALEASVSRVYAGIHYQSDCVEGNKEGIQVGTLVIEKLKNK